MTLYRVVVIHITGMLDKDRKADRQLVQADTVAMGDVHGRHSMEERGVRAIFSLVWA